MHKIQADYFKNEHPDFNIETTPNWVESCEFVNIDADADYSYLQVEDQYFVTDDRLTHYFKRRIRMRDNQDLNDNAQLNFVFDSTYQVVRFHDLKILRGDVVIDLSLLLQDVSVLQRETQLERRMYDGYLTINMVIPDLRVGDQLIYAVSYDGYNPLHGEFNFIGLQLSWGVKIFKQRMQIVWASSSPMFVKNHGKVMDPVVAESVLGRMYTWEFNCTQQQVYEDGVPGWYRAPWIQVCSQRSWKDVAMWACRLFTSVEDVDPLMDEVLGKIRAASGGNLEKQILAAIHFVQNEMSYVSAALGENSHRPADPKLSLQRRYGDCKDKSLLLTALLRHLGVVCHPVLVNAYLLGHVVDMAPAPQAFNHVICLVTFGGDRFWIDPTIDGQGGNLKNIYQPSYGLGLIVKAESEDLTIIENALEKPIVETVEEYDVSQGKIKPCILKLKSTYRKYEADNLRRFFRSQGEAQVEQVTLNALKKTYSQVRSVEKMRHEDDLDGNEVTLHEVVEIADFWKKNVSGHVASFYPLEFQRFLPFPRTADRLMPFGLPCPVHVKSQVWMALDGSYPLGMDDVVINRNYLTFSSTPLARKYNVVTFDYDLKILKDAINPSEISDYKQVIQEINGNTNLQLNVNEKSAKKWRLPFEIKWWWIWVLLFLASRLLQLSK